MRMKRRFWIAFSLGLFLAGLLSLNVAPVQGVKTSRFDQLTQGVNLAHWFAQAPLTAKNFQTRITAQDIQYLKTLGFKHVRLPLDPEVLWNDSDPKQLKAKNLQYFDDALDLILSRDLAVIVDLHPKANFKQRLYRDSEFVSEVAQFWQALAEHLSDRSPERVFLEVLNEPDVSDPTDWNLIQLKLLAAMRSGAPEHTLIASANLRVGNNWDEIKALEALLPVKDPNVVYNFHFYQPKPFVSQGAEWGWKVLQHYQNVPYPSSPKAVAPLLADIENPVARKQLQTYGEQQWNVAKLDGQIRRAAAWAKKHRVYLTCNEFGVYRRFAPAESRRAWLHDVRSLLEKYDIGWTVWEYDRGFGFITRQKDKPIADQKIVQVLLSKG